MKMGKSLRTGDGGRLYIWFQIYRSFLFERKLFLCVYIKGFVFICVSRKNVKNNIVNF